MKAKSKEERERRNAEKKARHERLLNASREGRKELEKQLNQIDNALANMTDKEIDNMLNQTLFEEGEAEREADGRRA